MKNMKNLMIAIDAMGGDNAPLEICKGAIAACKEFEDIDLALVGNSEQIKKCIEEKNMAIVLVQDTHNSQGRF